MKLVDNARSAWRWFSVQAMALAATTQLVWLSLTPEQQAEIGSGKVSTGTAIVLGLGLIGRLIDQRKPIDR